MNLHLRLQHPHFEETPDLCVEAHLGNMTYRRITIFFKDNEFRLVSEVAHDATDAIMWQSDHMFHPKPAKGETLEQSGLLAYAPEIVKEMVRLGTQMKIDRLQEAGQAAIRRNTCRPR